MRVLASHDVHLVELSSQSVRQTRVITNEEPFTKPITLLAGHGSQANRLMVITHGVVSVDRHGHLLCTLRPGDFFGHLSLLVEHPWVRSAASNLCVYVCVYVCVCVCV